MRKLKTLFTVLLVLCITITNAEDFLVNGIYYNITSEEDKTVEVTFKGDYYYSYENEYTGDVIIPETVTYSKQILSQKASFDDWTSANTEDDSYKSQIYDITVEAGDLLKFDWSVSSETNYDWLTIYLDGVQIVESSGEKSGSYEEIFETAGTYELLVIYEKDHSDKDGDDQGKIYNIVILEEAIQEITYRVTSIGNEAFSGCPDLTSIEIHNSITSIGKYAFFRNYALTNVVIPNSVTSIGEYAFKYCSGLSNIIVGKSVTTIGKDAFSNCSNLKTVTSKIPADKLFTIETNVFNGIHSDATLYVSGAAIDKYKETAGWKVFSNFSSYDYCLKYTVDGEEYYTCYLEAGEELPVIDMEKIEGKTFSGWKDIDNDEDFLNPIDIASNADAMLYTNAKCTNTQYNDQFTSWNVLFDNDVNTIFHSEYANNDSKDGLDHYIRVDMGEGKSIGQFKLTYTTRNVENNNNVSPKTMVVEGSNSSNGEYTVIATLTNLPGTKSTVYESQLLGSDNTAYRYIRFRVTETHGDAKVYKHPYFAISELGMMKVDNVPSIMPARDLTLTGSYSLDNYTVKYIVDGNLYRSVTVACGATITPIEAPTKEGYTFSGWKDVPTTMPAKDLTINGAFTINKYTITLLIKGALSPLISQEITLNYGTAIPNIEVPNKEGYTFNWEQPIPTTMPAENVTINGEYKVNNYTITYLVDGETYTTETVAYGTQITLIANPTKEGHTFSGWSKAPGTMPAGDIEIVGSFTVNTYTVTYVVGEEVVKTFTVEYGAEIPTVESDQEGYSFIWETSIPTSMPAYDLEIKGHLEINSYTLTYMVDGDVYRSETVEYNAEITPLEAPTKDGREFSGWSEIPETMPAGDVVVEGAFSYTVIFKVDDTIHGSFTGFYGTPITFPETPEKEGHTFVEWENLSETIPAEDLVTSAVFEANKYKVMFVINNETIQVFVEYGTEIPLPEGVQVNEEDLPATMPARDLIINATYKSYTLTLLVEGQKYAKKAFQYKSKIPNVKTPFKEGYTFKWDKEIPETMPAEDLTINGYFIKNGTAVDDVEAETEKVVYDLKGNRILDTENLERGIYIINGVKTFVK